LEEAERILDLAQRAHAIYMEEPDNFTRRRLVDAVVSKVTVQDNRALSNLWEPFDSLSKVALASKSPDHGPLWWAVVDAYRTSVIQSLSVHRQPGVPQVAVAGSGRAGCGSR
jgi:hypothetical protein